MVNLTINGKEIQAVEGTTILEAAKNAGIVIPTLCYFKDLNEIGACRVCMVEVEGIETQLFAACKTYVEEGMIVYTDSTRARKVRRDNIRLILSQHDCHCPTCARSGNCSLQTLANQLNILDHPYKAEYQKENTWDLTAPLIKNAAKCIKCMRCIQVCDKIQSLNVWDLANTGSRTCVDVRDNLTIREVDCSFCGQCITHCPVGALGARDDTDKVLEYIDDPEYVTVVQVAPAVRTAWAEMFGIEREKATPKRMAAALRQLGFDYVFDTNFAADLTIMEEASEFVERFTHQDKYKWPMFTSCCPGWVRFIKSQFPAFVDNVSTSKSPQQMFGAIAKSYFAQRIGIDPHKIRCISVMPCVAKKSECAIPIMNDACGDPDVDIVITTREFDRMLRQKSIVVENLQEEEFDSPLGSGTGAAIIFGATGGVMDAALRTAYNMVTGTNPDPDAFYQIRGMKGWKEANFDVPGAGTVRIAVASGLGNARKLLTALAAGEVQYDFVEIMACPGGCSGGGGQPIADGEELAEERGQLLWRLDKGSQLRYSHENPDIQELYKEYLVKPMSEKAEHLLHTDQHGWLMPNEK